MSEGRDRINFLDEMEANDGVRGYTLGTNGDLLDEDEYFPLDYDQENGTNSARDEIDDDQPPTMPSEFYNEVDSFLKRSPPRIGESIDKKEKKKKKKKEDNDFSADVPSLPPVHRKVGGVSLPAIDQVDAKQSSKKSKTSSSDRKASKGIDSQLLREAFAYTDELLRNAVLEEAKEQNFAQQQSQQLNQQQRKGGNDKSKNGSHPRSAPSDGVADRDYLFYGSANPSSGKGKNAPVNIVRSLKSKSQQQGHAPSRSRTSAGGGDFNVTKDEEVDLKRNPVNFDDLVANFQSGATLDRLRRELQESQSSLQQSSQAIRNLSQQYLSRR